MVWGSELGVMRSQESGVPSGSRVVLASHAGVLLSSYNQIKAWSKGLQGRVTRNTTQGTGLPLEKTPKWPVTTGDSKAKVLAWV